MVETELTLLYSCSILERKKNRTTTSKILNIVTTLKILLFFCNKQLLYYSNLKWYGPGSQIGIEQPC